METNAKKPLSEFAEYRALPGRAHNVLTNNNIDTAEDLLKLENKQIRDWKNCGSMTAKQIMTLRNDLKCLVFAEDAIETSQEILLEGTEAIKGMGRKEKKKASKIVSSNGFVIFDEVIEIDDTGTAEIGFLALDLREGIISAVTKGMQDHTMIKYESSTGGESNYRLVHEPEEVLKRIDQVRQKIKDKA